MKILKDFCEPPASILFYIFSVPNCLGRKTAVNSRYFSFPFSFISGFTVYRSVKQFTASHYLNRWMRACSLFLNFDLEKCFRAKQLLKEIERQQG